MNLARFFSKKQENKKDLKNQYIRFYNDAIKECVFLDINKSSKKTKDKKSPMSKLAIISIN
jgi:hypothetical protein